MTPHSAALRVFCEPADHAPADTPPFQSNDATVRAVIAWYRDNPSRKIHSKVAEAERRRVWQLFCEHRVNPGTQLAFGDRPASSCKPFELLNFINAQPDVASDWTRKRWNATIQAPFNAAEKLQLIVKNPFRGVTFPEGAEGRDWTDDEYQQVLRHSSPHFRRLVVALRFSGMRPGEGRELTGPAIHADEGKVVIARHKNFFRTKKPRAIPTNSVLLKLFDWLRRHNPPGRSEVLLNSFGRPWTRSMACRTLLRIRAKVNAQVLELRRRMGPDGVHRETGRTIPAKLLTPLPGDVKLHGARHTFITQAQLNGVDAASAGAIAGHKHLRTTQKYTHVETKVEHLAEAMERAIKKPPRKPRPKTGPKPLPEMPLFDGLE